MNIGQHISRSIEKKYVFLCPHPADISPPSPPNSTLDVPLGTDASLFLSTGEHDMSTMFGQPVLWIRALWTRFS